MNSNTQAQAWWEELPTSRRDCIAGMIWGAAAAARGDHEMNCVLAVWKIFLSSATPGETVDRILAFDDELDIGLATIAPLAVGTLRWRLEPSAFTGWILRHRRLLPTERVERRATLLYLRALVHLLQVPTDTSGAADEIEHQIRAIPALRSWWRRRPDFNQEPSSTTSRQPSGLLWAWSDAMFHLRESPDWVAGAGAATGALQGAAHGFRFLPLERVQELQRPLRHWMTPDLPSEKFPRLQHT